MDLPPSPRMMHLLPSDSSYRTFCDLLSGYRLVTVLMQAVEQGVIEAVGASGALPEEVLERTGLQQQEGQRFLVLLVQLGLLEQYDGCLYLSAFSRRFLLQGGEDNQLMTLEFERLLIGKWGGLGEVLRHGQEGRGEDLSPAALSQRRELFHQAMHQAARLRAQELWDLVPLPASRGTIIDLGAGDGTYLRAFLERHPGWSGLACDLPPVLELARLAPDLPVSLHPCNLLDPDELAELTARQAGQGTIVLLSNLIHCYGPAEVETLLGRAGELVADDGLLVIHDFFRDGNSYGALYDAHMLVNTHNGRTYPFDQIGAMLRQGGFGYTDTIALPSYSHALLASRRPRPAADPLGALRLRARQTGFFAVAEVDPAGLVIEPWVTAKCRYGCAFHGRKWSCPPHSLSAVEFRELLGCYGKALVLAGQPPLETFQKNLLDLEKEAFLLGFKKALAFTGGPCVWCEQCDEQACRYPEKRRPSLESCGCDVFALAESAGLAIAPVKSDSDFVQYLGLLLVF